LVLNRILSGVESLDRILGGGFPVPSLVTVIGDATGGEASTFLRQMTWIFLKKGFEILYYTVDQSADDTREFFRSVGLDIEPFEKNGWLHFADFFSQGAEALGEKLVNEPEKVAEKVFRLKDFILAENNFAASAKKKGHEDLLVVLDSLTPIFAAVSEQRDVFLFSQTLKYSTRNYNALGMTLIHRGVSSKQVEDTIRHMADGTIEFRYDDPEKSQLKIRVQKIAGAMTVAIPVTVENGSMAFHIPPT
jgi:KaiC/GvpD/RAD55 family RecA-like ATPase